MKFGWGLSGVPLPRLNARRGTLLAIVCLGLLSYALEGVGLYLFLPLLSALQDPVGSFSGMPVVVRKGLQLLPAEGQLPALASFVVASVLLKNFVAYLNSSHFAKVDADISHRTRCDLYASILNADPGYVENQVSGRLANTLLAETWRAARASGLLYTFITDACSLLIFSAVLLVISWQATLLVTPVLALIVGVLHLSTRASRPLGAAAVQSNELYTNRAWECLTGLNTVRVFNRATYETDRLTKASLSVREQFFRLQLITSRTPLIFESVVALALGLWIVVLATAGFGVPTVAVFLVVLYRMQPRVRSIISARASLMELSAAVAEVETLRKECEGSRPQDGMQDMKAFRECIRFEGVCVRYSSSERDALHAFSLSVRRHTTVALVGRSGAGKSSVIELLCRNRVASSGSITIDGTELAAIRRQDWFDRISVVPQDIFLFDASIHDNIAYGRLGASREDVVRAARLAHAHEFIELLPAGYDTAIGDRGVRLSGGQRQRIAFARALVKKPEILLIDEATNALDSHSEELIHASLQALSKSMTIIMVAHRLSTVRTANNIVVMNRGVVVEQGDYAALVAKGGLFAAMARLQSLDVELEAASQNAESND